MKTKEITFKDKVYTIPESIGQIPAKKRIDMMSVASKLGSADVTEVMNYNFYFLSTILNEDQSYIEEMAYDDFTELLNLVNTNMSEEVKLDVPETIEVPETLPYGSV